jgi:hypothetical protein
VVTAYRELGFEPRACRPASAADLAAAHSTWGRRLLASGRERRTWLIELGAPRPRIGTWNARAAASAGGTWRSGRRSSRIGSS